MVKPRIQKRVLRIAVPRAFHSDSSRQVPRSWITSTRLQAEISKLAWPRRSHPARSTRVYNVLAYFYADYFDAGTPDRNPCVQVSIRSLGFNFTDWFAPFSQSVFLHVKWPARNLSI